MKKRYNQEIEKLNRLGRTYLHRHPALIEQKALVGEIARKLGYTEDIIRVAAAVSGIVSEVHVFRKQEVQKSSALLETDKQHASAAWKAAEVQLKLAQTRLDVILRSYEAGNSGIAELKEVQSELRAADTAMDVAKIDLEDLTVRAPADGVVLNVDVKVGEYVSPENPVVQLRAKSP